MLLPVVLWFISNSASGETLHIGQGYPYATLSQAIVLATPGDTLMVHSGTYSGGLYIENLKGTSSNWIYIVVAPGDTVIYEGGSNGWQMTDAEYIHIRGFTFRHQTGNGFNMDDGGSYDTPSHHIVFEGCTFSDIGAFGNNDLLKLSGLDEFTIYKCVFLNGAAGGSGIDMVGSHNGIIRNCHFENLGSNSIQAKGGSKNVVIEGNFFKNGGSRAVNLGGSTGLPYFRPIDAGYEAADLKVYSNVFIGSEASVAFVGCINTEVINNTIYLPSKWVIRILQETVDTSRFAPCGNNFFRNNIVYHDNKVTTDCNIGPNTSPETFTFSNNLWYHSQNIYWPGPVLPVADVDQILGQDPLFMNIAEANFNLQQGSPAIGKGYSVSLPQLDFNENYFSQPRSIGAFEGIINVGIENSLVGRKNCIHVFPNPGTGCFYFQNQCEEAGMYKVVNANGEIIVNWSHLNRSKTNEIVLTGFPKGIYWLLIESGKEIKTTSIVLN